MHVGAIAWTYLSGLHPAVFREVGRDLKVLIVDRAARRDFVIRLHFEDLVRFAELPAFGECGQLRHLRRVAFWCASIDPADQGVDFVLRKAEVVAKLSVSGVGMPWWHYMRRHLLANRLRPRPHLPERDERHRRHLAWAMAAHALCVKDRSYIVAEGRNNSCRHRSLRCGGNANNSRCGQAKSNSCQRGNRTDAASYSAN